MANERTRTTFISCRLAIEEVIINGRPGASLDELADLAVIYGTRAETTKEEALSMLQKSLLEICREG